jgi:hypothetical protein
MKRVCFVTQNFLLIIGFQGIVRSRLRQVLHKHMNEIIDNKLDLDKTRILRIQSEMQRSVEEFIQADHESSAILPELREEAPDVVRAWFSEMRYTARRYAMQGALHSRAAPYWRKKLAEMPRDAESSSFEQITNWKKWLNLTEEQYTAFKEKYYARLADRHPTSRRSKRRRELDSDYLLNQPTAVESAEELVA